MKPESAMRYNSFPVDTCLVWITAVLAGFGVLMVYDSSAVSAALRHKFSNQYFFFIRQSIWYCIGFCVMLTAARIPIQKIQRWIFPALILMILLLVLVLIPGIGMEAGGARRWLRVGPLSVQPGEVIRLFLVLYLAHFLTHRKSQITAFRTAFVPAAIVTGTVVCLLVAQPKTGSALLIITLAALIFYVAGIPVRQLILAGLVSAPLAGIAFLRSSYIALRFDSWLHPADHMRGLAFQSIQSLIAIGSGGFLGQGLGQGRQKLFYLPESHTDFILPVISEELGLIGSALLIAGYGVILFLGIKTARESSDRFSAILAAGLTFMVILPACLNMMVATNLLPVTGVPLPLISFGGTALITDMAALGLLANIASSNARHREKVLYHGTAA